MQCLIQEKNQSRDAIKGGLAPVAASIYDQPSFAKAYPFHQLIKQQLQNYGIRPQTPAYADVTLAIQKTLSPTSNINPKRWSAHCVTKSSCPCPHRPCCERRHRPIERPGATHQSQEAPEQTAPALSDASRSGSSLPRGS